MLFRHSAITELTRNRATETAPRPPTTIHPLLLGSGRVGLGLDATGMQGLNSRINRLPNTLSITHGDFATNGNLYIRRDCALSKHHGQQDQADPSNNYRLMPCGWLDYVLVIDDHAFDAHRIAAEASDWKRSFTPGIGLAKTEFTLAGVHFTWQAVMPIDDVVADFAFTFAAVDGEAHDIACTVRCNLTLRDGLPLATARLQQDATDTMASARWQADSDSASARIYTPAVYTWALACSTADARYETEKNAICASFGTSGADGQTSFRLACGSELDGTHTEAETAARIGTFQKTAPEDTIQNGCETWQEFFAEAADIHCGDSEREFLMRQAQYVLRAGGSWRNGYPLGTLWNGTFGGATFWDTFFAADGMLRCGHVQPVREFCDWLVAARQSEGRPFYWMTYFDGTPVETEDTAYQVCLAYAGIAIRLYEITQREDDLRERAFPILKQLAKYALAEVVEPVDGTWRLRGIVSHDVGADDLDATHEPGMLAWVSVCLAKFAEYADVLSVDDHPVETCRRLAADLKSTPLSLEDPGLWGAWYPYLLGLNPLYDDDSFRRYIHKTYGDRMAVPIYNQPWFAFCEAAALAMTGFPELARETQEAGLNLIAGCGYFTETPYVLRSGGYAPYVPASGAFLSSMAIPFAHGSMWTDDVHVATGLSTVMRSQYMSWERLHTLNGAVVSGTYSPERLECMIVCPRPMRAHLAAPAYIAGEPLRVTVDGTPQEDAAATGETVIVPLPKGTHRLAIERDVEFASQVTVLEPMAYGAQIVEQLEHAGLAVRWLRSMDLLPRLIDTTSAILWPVSYVASPVETVDTLRMAAENGRTVITTFHGGRIDVDRAMAELCGVQATQATPHWACESVPVVYTLTATGRELLPDLPPTFEIPQAAQFEPDPTPDTEVIATAADRTPVVTCRRIGKGRVWWIAAGSRSAGADHHPWYTGADIHMWGRDQQDRYPRQWCSTPAWHQLMAAVVKTATNEDRQSTRH